MDDCDFIMDDAPALSDAGTDKQVQWRPQTPLHKGHLLNFN